MTATYSSRSVSAEDPWAEILTSAPRYIKRTLLHSLAHPHPTRTSSFPPHHWSPPQCSQSSPSHMPLAILSQPNQLAVSSLPPNPYVLNSINLSPFCLQLKPYFSESQTLRLADYDISPTTGFAPSTPLCARLPTPFDAWEPALDLVNCGTDSVLCLGEDTSSEAQAKRDSSQQWQQSIRAVRTLHSLNCRIAHAYAHRCQSSTQKFFRVILIYYSEHIMSSLILSTFTCTPSSLILHPPPSSPLLLLFLSSPSQTTLGWLPSSPTPIQSYGTSLRVILQSLWHQEIFAF